MSTRRKTNQLFVYMNGHHVGTLTRIAGGQLTFSYEPDWLARKGARPISLSMPLTEAPLKGDVAYNFFDNLLPDKELIRERIQARFQIPTKQSFDLLSSIGIDCVGALQLLTQPLEVDIRTTKATPLDDRTISMLLKNYQTAPLGMERNTDFRISIAGAQEKTALLWHQNQWCLPSGATPTSHIIKLPIGHIEHAGIDLSDSVENEWLCLQILRAFGLPVNKAEIAYFEESKALVVERFDRRWSEDKRWLMRLPQEDMCQALGRPSALKYESDGGPGIVDIMNVCRGAYAAKENRLQFMKSVFLYWILGAIDGHAKNFSIFLEANGHYTLTPLYDVISAYPLAEKHQLEWRQLKMAMSLQSKNHHYRWHSIQPRHWLSMSTRCQFPPLLMQATMDEVADNLESVITQVSNMLPNDFPAHIADPIFAGMRKIKDKI